MCDTMAIAIKTLPKSTQVHELVLSRPGQIEERFVDIPEVPTGCILLKPLMAGICGSEIHYYLGNKDPEKLQKRLPLVFLHEGICEVVFDNNGGHYNTGDRVIAIPLNPCGKCRPCLEKQENLCEQAKFMGATAPGLARSQFIYPAHLVMPIPQGLSDEIACLAEPLSIVYRSIINNKLYSDMQCHKKIAVIGDGPFGYLFVALLHHLVKIPRKQLFFIGRSSEEKLALAKDIAVTINMSKEKDQKIFNELIKTMDLVIETAGGDSMNMTIPQAIELIKTGGTIIVMGISDKQSPIRWDIIVNRGINVHGESRSRITDYELVLGMMTIPRFQALLKKMIYREIFSIKKPDDLSKVMDLVHDRRGIERVLVRLNL